MRALPRIILTLVAVATTCCPVATQNLAPINEDNLDPNAAHVCRTSQKEPYTQISSFTQYLRVQTTTWCFALPPRCTKYMIQASTAYRVDTLYRERVKYFCCDGYKPLPQHSYCVPKCTDDCNADKAQGYCVTPGNCVCHAGYKGDTCESGCPDNKWGPDCSNTCHCGTHGSCDPETGNCVCQIGYTGQDCSQPCVNSFGPHCIHPCVCENNATCDIVNGKCTCRPGFYGAYCHKKCDTTSTSEIGCQQTCPCQNGGVCQEGNGACVCAPGFKGDYCTVSCDRFHWGINCTNTCTCNYGKCDPATGYCSCDLGYAGDRCEIKCPSGYYGVACLTKCGCQNEGKCYWNSTEQQIRCNCTGTGYHGYTCAQRDCPVGQYLLPGAGSNEYPCRNCSCDTNPGRTESCHPLTGRCTCQPGYKGERCSELCTMPFYGNKCEEVCMCEHGTCHHVTGECVSCDAGYIGENCTDQCPDGTWGMGCTNKCSCKNNAVCHHETGYCQCEAGFYGMQCESYCDVGKYGPGCGMNCTCDTETSLCNPYDGQCQCKPGYTGTDCQVTCPPWKFGYFCRESCNCDVDRTESCDPHFGICRCKGGWTGITCNDKCPSYTWGPNCVKLCNCGGRPCNPKTGACDQVVDGGDISVVGQQTGSGTDSAASAGTMPVIIAVVIPCIILLLIIAAVVYYFMRKIKIMKDDSYRNNYRVEFDSTQANGSLPNGNSHTGIANPTYEDENRRNDNRYPHLSQRLSMMPPPLPHRQQACDEIDAEKLQVSMPPTTRPPSSAYADLDDVDRYTTLKSVSNPTLTSTTAQKGSLDFGTGEFSLPEEDPDEGQSSATSTPQAIGGFDNKAYDLEQTRKKEMEANLGHSKDVEKKASVEYDVPVTQINKSRRASLESDGYLEPKSVAKANPFLDYVNPDSSVTIPSARAADKKSLSSNQYDTPKRVIFGNPGNHDSVHSSSSGYLTPVTVADNDLDINVFFKGSQNQTVA